MSETLESPKSDILGKQINVLDKGHIRLIDYMGSDAAIVQAARVSYGAGTKKASEDSALIRYLMKHYHHTPFEMINIKFHVKAPLFVFAQWHRHRTAQINQVSARYSIITDEFYIPSEEQIQVQNKDNKQGRGEKIPENQAKAIRKSMKDDQEHLYRNYIMYAQNSGTDNIKPDRLRTSDTNDYFDDFTGIAREIARCNLPVSIYSEMYWSCNLRNIFNFLKLRMDSHAQYEIRVYAEAMFEIIKDICPVACQAFLDYQLNAKTFSSKELAVIKDIIDSYNSEKDSKYNILNKEYLVEKYKLSKREADEFLVSMEVESIRTYENIIR